MAKAIYIFTKDIPDPRTGIGYVLSVFLETFPHAVMVSAEHELEDLGEENIVLAPRIFPTTHPHVHLLAVSFYNTPAKVIQTPFIDCPAPPLYIMHSIGRADLIHAPSTFIAKLLRPNRSFVLPIPAKPFGKRKIAPRSHIVGAVVSSLHERKNLEGYISLASMLPQWKFHIVISKDWRLFPHREQVVRKLWETPNIVVHENLNDDELREFYYMLDWFVVLSGGEAYSLPVREALRCGVPVIAPRHTAFLDLAGVSGVFLVDTQVVTIAASDGHSYLLEFPNLQKVKQILENKTPPQPEEVEDPTPSLAEWAKKWHEIIADIGKNDTAAWVQVKEPSAFWGLMFTNLTLGLNDVSLQWAKRVNGIPFSLHETLPHGVETPIILPYGHGITDWNSYLPAPPFFHIVATLRKQNPKAPIVLWVHNTLPIHIYSVLRPFVDVFAGTTEAMLLLHPYLKCLLRLPIGSPPNPTPSQGDYYLIWGLNYTAFDWLKVFLRFFRHPVRLIYTLTTELPAAANHALVELYHFLASLPTQHTRHTIQITLPKDTNELEEELDGALGYICIDFYYPHGKSGEASAKIPRVLRKGKPIICNDAPRNMAWLPYIKPIRFSDDLIRGEMGAVVRLIQEIEAHAEDYIPTSVPSVEEEIKEYEIFLRHVRKLTRHSE